MRRTARIPKDLPAPKRQPDPRRHAQHLAFVRSLSCCYCGKPPQSEAHHENFGLGDNAMGRKADDKTCVPLCRRHHAERHNRGPLTFWGDTDIPLRLYEALWKVSGDIDKGQRAVARTVQAVQMRRAG